MAFGGLKGTLQGNGGSIGTSNALTGSVSVSVGDLVWVCFGQQTNLTASSASDNLGNSYSAQNAGSDPGAATGRCFYSRVTVGGTLTQVTVAASSSTNDWAGLVAVIEGPVVTSPLDANPSNVTSDTSSPFACPSTGSLAQAREIVIGWGAANQSTTWAATSPNLLAGNVNNSSNIKVAIGYQAVNATDAVAPQFTAGSNPTACILGTASLKRAPSADPGAGSATATGYAPTVHRSYRAVPGAGSVNATGYAPARSVSSSASPGAGSVLATGYAPTVAATHNYLSIPGAGSALATGYAPSAERDYVAVPGASSVFATGYAPIVRQNILALPGAGTATATGYAPMAQYNYRIAVPGDTATITGYAPTAERDYVTAPGVGSVIATGYAPTLERRYTLAIPAGTVEATGYAPTVPASGYLVRVTWATLEVPVASGSLTRLPGLGSALTTGYAPTLQRNYRVTPGAGSAPVDGAAPAVRFGFFARPDASAAIITGYAPVATVVENKTGSTLGREGEAGAVTGVKGVLGAATGREGAAGVVTGVRGVSGSAVGCAGASGVAAGKKDGLGVVIGQAGVAGAATGAKSAAGGAVGAEGAAGAALGTSSPSLTGGSTGAVGIIGSAIGVATPFVSPSGVRRLAIIELVQSFEQKQKEAFAQGIMALFEASKQRTQESPQEEPAPEVSVSGQPIPLEEELVQTVLPPLPDYGRILARQRMAADLEGLSRLLEVPLPPLPDVQEFDEEEELALLMLMVT